MESKKDLNLYILSWIVVVGFFCELGFLLHLVHSGIQISDSSGSVFMLMDALSSALGMVMMYFFGSTKGSADKNQLIANMANPKDGKGGNVTST